MDGDKEEKVIDDTSGKLPLLSPHSHDWMSRRIPLDEGDDITTDDEAEASTSFPGLPNEDSNETIDLSSPAKKMRNEDDSNITLNNDDSNVILNN